MISFLSFLDKPNNHIIPKVIMKDIPVEKKQFSLTFNENLLKSNDTIILNTKTASIFGRFLLKNTDKSMSIKYFMWISLNIPVIVLRTTIVAGTQIGETPLESNIEDITIFMIKIELNQILYSFILFEAKIKVLKGD